jgi:hypothetical protein
MRATSDFFRLNRVAFPERSGPTSVFLVMLVHVAQIHRQQHPKQIEEFILEISMLKNTVKIAVPLLTLGPALFGCEHYRQVAVAVRRVDTTMPISQANVEVAYSISDERLRSNPPRRSHSNTNGNGVARVWVDETYPFTIFVTSTQYPEHYLQFAQEELSAPKWQPALVMGGGNSQIEVKVSKGDDQK